LHNVDLLSATRRAGSTTFSSYIDCFTAWKKIIICGELGAFRLRLKTILAFALLAVLYLPVTLLLPLTRLLAACNMWSTYIRTEKQTGTERSAIIFKNLICRLIVSV